jgi:hypothetical protein
MTVSLFRDLARSGWHSSLMTTYSVDPAFYDGSIEYRLRTYGCENNILMADAIMLKRAIAATPEAFRYAGRRYAIVPIQVGGCFHPKVHLRLGTDRARLIVGSANATAAGWGSNQEIVTAIDWSRSGEDETLSATGPLLKKAYDYLVSWLIAVPGDAIEFKLRLHRKDSPWLADFQANAEPIELPDGSAIDLFCERGDGGPGMLSRLSALLIGETTKRLIVISPYWDSDLSGLRDLRATLGQSATIVALNPGKNEFPVDALRAADSLGFVAIHDIEDAHRFLHAKVILAETEAADHLLFGSANCSDDALGRLTTPARNAEVSVYRRFPPERGIELLGLDSSKILDRSAIRQPLPNSKMFESGSSAVPAGTLEAIDKSLTWWPPTDENPDGAQILVGDEALPVRPVGNSQFRTYLTSEPIFPLIVRVQFADGRVSDPFIVQNETALRLASPGVTDRRLRSAFNRVLAGEDDIIDLALQAHLLFAGDAEESARQGHAAERPKQEAVTANPVDYATPEEFRQAVARHPATGESGRFNVEDPGLLELLAIILKGIVDVGGKEARKRQDEAEDRDLLAGETEDGDEVAETAPDDTPVAKPKPAQIEERVFTSEDIERRKRQLLKAMAAFDEMIAGLRASPGLMSNRLTAQISFIITLMIFACCKEHRLADGKSVRLMAFAPEKNVNRDLTFAVRAGRLLQQIWVGGHDGPIIDRLLVDYRHASMPDDVFYLIAISRWAITRAFAATSATPVGTTLSPYLHAAALKIYRSTLRYGPLDPTAERRSIEKLDASLGFSSGDTAKLIGYCRRFAQSAVLQPDVRSGCVALRPKITA